MGAVWGEGSVWEKGAVWGEGSIWEEAVWEEGTIGVEGPVWEEGPVWDDGAVRGGWDRLGVQDLGPAWASFWEVKGVRRVKGLWLVKVLRLVQGLTGDSGFGCHFGCPLGRLRVYGWLRVITP